MTTDHDDSRPPLDEQIEAFIADRDNARPPWPRAAQGTCGCATPSSFTPPSPDRGREPEFHGSATLLPTGSFEPDGPQPTEQAIRRALDRA